MSSVSINALWYICALLVYYILFFSIEIHNNYILLLRGDSSLIIHYS